MARNRRDDEDKDGDHEDEKLMDISLPYYKYRLISTKSGPDSSPSSDGGKEENEHTEYGNYYDRYYGLWAKNKHKSRYRHSHSHSNSHSIQHQTQVPPQRNLPPLIQDVSELSIPLRPPPSLSHPPPPAPPPPQIHMQRPANVMPDPYDHSRSRYNEPLNNR